MTKTVQIREMTAKGLLRLAEDIRDIHQMAGCSDKTFRDRLRMRLDAYAPIPVVEELRSALAAREGPPAKRERPAPVDGNAAE